MKTILFVLLALLFSLCTLSACQAAPGAAGNPPPAASPAAQASEQPGTQLAAEPDGLALLQIEELSSGDARYEEAMTRMQTESDAKAKGRNYPLPDGRMLINSHQESRSHILLRGTDGQERILVQGDESEGESAQRAYVYQFIEDTKFIYVIYGWEWTVSCGLYDLQTMQDHRFEEAGAMPLGIYANTLYSLDDVLYGGYTGTFHLTKTDLHTYQTTTLLSGQIPEAQLNRMLAYRLCAQDGLFLLLCGDYTDFLATDLYSYSLTTGELVQQISIEKDKRIGGFFALSDQEFLLFSWPDSRFEHSMLLLTLP